MNIHLPAILGFTRYRGFDPSPLIMITIATTCEIALLRFKPMFFLDGLCDVWALSLAQKRAWVYSKLSYRRSRQKMMGSGGIIKKKCCISFIYSKGILLMVSLNSSSNNCDTCCQARFFSWNSARSSQGNCRMIIRQFSTLSDNAVDERHHFFPLRYLFWLVVWNIFYFSIQLGMSSSQLTIADFHIFQRGGSTTQPDMYIYIVI